MKLNTPVRRDEDRSVEFKDPQGGGSGVCPPPPPGWRADGVVGWSSLGLGVDVSVDVDAVFRTCDRPSSHLHGMAVWQFGSLAVWQYGSLAARR